MFKTIFVGVVIALIAAKLQQVYKINPTTVLLNVTEAASKAAKAEQEPRPGGGASATDITGAAGVGPAISPSSETTVSQPSTTLPVTGPDAGQQQPMFSGVVAYQTPNQAPTVGTFQSNTYRANAPVPYSQHPFYAGRPPHTPPFRAPYWHRVAAPAHGGRH